MVYVPINLLYHQNQPIVGNMYIYIYDIQQFEEYIMFKLGGNHQADFFSYTIEVIVRR